MKTLEKLQVLKLSVKEQKSIKGGKMGIAKKASFDSIDAAPEE